MAPKRRKAFHDDDSGDERPWTEEQWEKEMRESDLRAARFGELLETFSNDPNCNEIVAREMGWTELADDLAAEEADDAPDDEATEDDDDAEAIEMPEPENKPAGIDEL